VAPTTWATTRLGKLRAVKGAMGRGGGTVGPSTTVVVAAARGMPGSGTHEVTRKKVSVSPAVMAAGKLG
jgi:hypothetical protein